MTMGLVCPTTRAGKCGKTSKEELDCVLWTLRSGDDMFTENTRIHLTVLNKGVFCKVNER